MESADRDKHDRVHERREDMFSDDNEEETTCSATGGEDRDDELRKPCCCEAADESIAPNVHGRVGLAPFTNVVAQEDLDWEID